MAHELAHYLVATDAERGRINFGLGDEPSIGSEREEHAVVAERTILAVVQAAAGIATLALQGRRSP
jgi:hypothetical protein